MKWRSFKIGSLKISIGQKRQLHSGIGFKQGCGTDYIGEYFAITWNGVEVYSQITKLHEVRK